jgi:hypothetical protein
LPEPRQVEVKQLLRNPGNLFTVENVAVGIGKSIEFEVGVSVSRGELDLLGKFPAIGKLESVAGG